MGFVNGEATAPWRPGSGRDAKTLRPGVRVQQQNMGLPPKWIVSNGTSYLSDFKWMSWGSRFRTPPNSYENHH